MHLERYEFEVKGNRYDFVSQGPKGEIKKAVFYYKVRETKHPLYNLSFGDWNEKINWIDDSVVTNNEDREKILAKVASTVVNFTYQNPDTFIFAPFYPISLPYLYQFNIPYFFTTFIYTY